jgi:multidrug efflux pump subunit AcrB
VFSRFFIDRPIFATVISVVITLAGGVAVFNLPVAQYPEVTPPTVQVTAIYPGANAYTLRDTVAAPIEEQVSGVEGMMYMSSQCTNNGTYTLTVTFKMGMDSDMAQVLVQNRVSLALPVIPALVQNEGITVKKQSPNTLLIVNLIGQDSEKSNPVYLSNYATIFIKDELARVSGVAGISYMGQRDFSLRVWLDPDRLAALKLSPMDVVTAISQQNIQVAAGQIGQPPVPKGQAFQLTINTKGRLTEPEEFASIVVKAGVSSPVSPGGGGSGDTATTGAAADSQGDLGGATDPSMLSTGIVRIKDVVTRYPKGDPKAGQPKVELDAQQYDTSCTLDNRPSVAMSIYQLPGSNALKVAADVRLKMKELKKSFPAGLGYRIVYDTTPFIDESVNEVYKTLIEAMILVAIVVLLFLQDWRAMILPMIDVPVSLIGTFAVMALLGFTLNNLTLFGLVLAIGIVVDDAIVVLENIERLMATGLDARDATIKAMEEITGPVLAITLVLCAVFVPVCFLPGITGQFFRQFAVTIAVSTVISAINALTMTPSRAVVIFKTEGHAHGHKREALPWWIFGLAGLLTVALWPTLPFRPADLLGVSPDWLDLPTDPEALREMDWRQKFAIRAIHFLPGMLVGLVVGWVIIRPVNAGLGWFFRGFNRGFDRLTIGYGRVVGVFLTLSIVMMLIYGGLLVLTGWQFTTAPVGFVPQQDKGYLILTVQLQDAASLERTERAMAKLNQLLLKERDNPHPDIPGVGHTIAVSGQSVILNATAPNLGSMYVLLTEFRDRPSADVIAKHLQERCQEELRGALVSVYGGPPIDGLGTTGGFKLIIKDRTNRDPPDQLQLVSQQIVEQGNHTPGLKDLVNSSRADTPWLYLDIDRDQCLALGVQVSDVFSTLQVYLGSYYVNNFNQFGRTWQVNVQADPVFRNRVRDIRRLQVRNQIGQMIPLASLLHIRNEGGPVSLMRYNMYSATAITGNPAPGTSSGEATARMAEIADLTMPRETMAREWTELAYLQEQAGNLGLFIFGLAVAFVFLVLAAQYESWTLPLAVILVVPMCLLCSITGVLLAGGEVNIFTLIGFVVLVGLASKNAILIVEVAKERQEQGVPRREAALEGARLRLRPILMTSFAFIFGVVPLVLGTGAGAEMRRALGMAVFSGMLGVTFFGVFLTPVFFYTLRKFSEHRGHKAHVVPLTETRPATPHDTGRDAITASSPPHPGTATSGSTETRPDSAPPSEPPTRDHG